MKKFTFNTILISLGLYVLLHLVLGSSFVQRRIVTDLRQVLSEYGLGIEIESIEFSAFSAKIYLNRVVVRSKPDAKIALPEPISIDKIKIEFQPIALLYKQLQISELILYHPKVNLPEADLFYKKIESIFKPSKNKTPAMSFHVIVKKAGLVDAFVDISIAEAHLKIFSRSLTGFVQNITSANPSFTLNSTLLELVRGKMNLSLTKVDIDLDKSPSSIRLNRGIVESENMSIHVKGVSSVPSGKEILPGSANLSYDIKIPLSVITEIPELKAPSLGGEVESSGTFKVVQGIYSGNGALKYDKISVDGYQIGEGSLEYALSEKTAFLSKLQLKYGGGILSAKQPLSIQLKEKFPIEGKLYLNGVRLEGILDSVKSTGNPIRLAMAGLLDLKGTLRTPFEISAQAKLELSPFRVLKDNKKPEDEINTVLKVLPSELEGSVVFASDKLSYKANVHGLDGDLAAEGFVSYDSRAKVRAVGKKLSLFKLKHISELEVGGICDLSADVDVNGNDVQIAGNFEATNSEIANLRLGNVRGQAVFRNLLLSFENIESSTRLDPIRGQGFVDFNPKDTHYKFLVESKRIEINEVFKIFDKRPLSFEKASEGEASARVSIEGGHDDQGLEVITSGQAKSFQWYDEKWQSAAFAYQYRPNASELRRLTLLKKSGGLEVKANWNDLKSHWSVASHSLRIDELEHLGKAPIVGEADGQVVIDGSPTGYTGSGEINLLHLNFRGISIPNSLVRLGTNKGRFELQGSLANEKLLFSLTQEPRPSKKWQLGVSSKEFDALPLIAFLLKRDIPTIDDFRISGQLDLLGEWDDLNSLKGSGKIQSVLLGAKGTPMSNKQPVDIRWEKGLIKVSPFLLVGKDSQLESELTYQYPKEVKLRVDGKWDLELIQPFIPGLEMGSGKVSTSIRWTGKPDELQMLGNISLEDGAFRLTGIADDFKAVQVQISLIQDKISIDKFSALMNGGEVKVTGDVRFPKFKDLVPSLRIMSDRVLLKQGNYLGVRYSGDMKLTGLEAPYLLSGTCRIHEANLTSFEIPEGTGAQKDPILRWDIKCEGKEKLFVNTSVMNAEFKGDLNLLGNNVQMGLLGNLESVRGSILFRERRFNLNLGTVKFESPNKILPRFNMSSRATVQETSTTTAGQTKPGQNYEVSLQVYGIPSSYKILLTSTPELAEADIISLLLLGVTSRGQDGNYLDLGTTIVGQLPIQSKIESQLGVDIRLNSQTTTTSTKSASPGSSSTTGTLTEVSVPSVKIQKEITNKTKVSYSNSLEAIPFRELKIEHMLDENLTVNGIAIERSRTGFENQTTQSYGVDFRYRFQFE